MICGLEGVSFRYRGRSANALTDIDLTVAEGTHAYLGGGAMALHPILDALDALPQEMTYCFEFPGGGEPDERIRKSLAYVRER